MDLQVRWQTSNCSRHMFIAHPTKIRWCSESLTTINLRHPWHQVPSRIIQISARDLRHMERTFWNHPSDKRHWKKVMALPSIGRGKQDNKAQKSTKAFNWKAFHSKIKRKPFSYSNKSTHREICSTNIKLTLWNPSWIRPQRNDHPQMFLEDRKKVRCRTA